VFDSLEEPSEEEEDMLDAAFALTETYGCLYHYNKKKMRCYQIRYVFIFIALLHCAKIFISRVV
jgi:hypothetical protein